MLVGFDRFSWIHVFHGFCVMTQNSMPYPFPFPFFDLQFVQFTCILRWMSINLHLGRAQPFCMSAWSKAEQLPNVRLWLNSEDFWIGYDPYDSCCSGAARNPALWAERSSSAYVFGIFEICPQ